MKIVIIDYGLGNTKSIFNACKTITDKVIVSKKKKDNNVILLSIISVNIVVFIRIILENLILMALELTLGVLMKLIHFQ